MWNSSRMAKVPQPSSPPPPPTLLLDGWHERVCVSEWVCVCVCSSVQVWLCVKSNSVFVFFQILVSFSPTSVDLNDCLFLLLFFFFCTHYIPTWQPFTLDILSHRCRRSHSLTHTYACAHTGKHTRALSRTLSLVHTHTHSHTFWFSSECHLALCRGRT